jgi:hypothetical protein
MIKQALFIPACLLLLALMFSPLWAQSFSDFYPYSDNGANVTLYTVTSKAGNVLTYAIAYNTATKTASVAWQYNGHTPYQAKIVTVAIPASASSKSPVPAVPSVTTQYTSLSTALAAFNKLP